MSTHAQIVATIGPSAEKEGILKRMIESHVDVARFNFEWFDSTREGIRIEAFRAIAKECGRTIPIIADLPGARIQLAQGHTYDPALPFSITKKDEEMVRWCVEKNIEYVALSFVGSGDEVTSYREMIKRYGGSQKIIAKIERSVAVDAIDAILAVSDAVMVARGDLGKEVPLEKIPFVQQMLIAKAHAAQKPVITATQMLLSMTLNQEPTRAEVTDVETAIMEGSDAVMLSEETASGQFPVEAVRMMERIIVEAEKHRTGHTLHPL